MHDVLTANEVADYLKVNLRTIYRLVKREQEGLK
jgi:excisionase family DNA binding protein